MNGRTVKKKIIKLKRPKKKKKSKTFGTWLKLLNNDVIAALIYV